MTYRASDTCNYKSVDTCTQKKSTKLKSVQIGLLHTKIRLVKRHFSSALVGMLHLIGVGRILTGSRPKVQIPLQHMHRTNHLSELTRSYSSQNVQVSSCEKELPRDQPYFLHIEITQITWICCIVSRVCFLQESTFQFACTNYVICEQLCERHP